MSTNLKSCRYAHRLNDEKATVNVSLPKKEHYRIITVEKFDEKLNRVLKFNEKQLVNRAKEMEHFQASDFQLENLLSINATLSETRLNGNIDKSIDNIEQQLNSLTNE